MPHPGATTNTAVCAPVAFEMFDDESSRVEPELVAHAGVPSDSIGSHEKYTCSALSYLRRETFVLSDGDTHAPIHRDERSARLGRVRAAP